LLPSFLLSFPYFPSFPPLSSLSRSAPFISAKRKPSPALASGETVCGSCSTADAPKDVPCSGGLKNACARARGIRLHRCVSFLSLRAALVLKMEFFIIFKTNGIALKIGEVGSK
jgi:hypothetical protein